MLDTSYFTFEFLSVLSIALILILTTLGLAVIFGLLKVINMAHGDFMTLGAYLSLVITSVSVSPWFGILGAALGTGAVGILVEKVVIRSLYTKPLQSLLATWGIGLLIREVIIVIFGPAPQNAPVPTTGSVLILGTTFPVYRFLIMIVSAITIIFLLYLFNKTNFGLKTLAVIQNNELAASIGVNTTRMYWMSFGIGSALAGFAGALISPITGMDPNFGLNFLINAFIVVVVGGIGTLIGPVISGLALGEISNWISFVRDPVTAYFALLIIAILFIRFRPQGLIR